MKQPLAHTSSTLRGTIAALRAARLLGPIAMMVIASAGLLAQSGQSLTLVYPNGGEVFTAGEVIEIRWDASGFGDRDEVEVEFSIDGGSRWRRIARTSASAERISWIVDNRPSATALARVITRDGDVSDESDMTFEIKEDPLDATIMLAPNGSETWAEGETHTLRWQAPLDAVNVMIELSPDFGITWSTVAQVPAGITQYSWIVPRLSDKPVTTAVMRVSVAEAPDHFDLSDAPFTILPAAPVDTIANDSTILKPSLHVLYPNGGERLREDSIVAVRWESANISGDVSVEWSFDGGTTWSGIENVLGSVGGAAWKVPGRQTTEGLVRVVTKDGGAVQDISDASFTIVRKEIAADAILLIVPNGGEVWNEGETRTITWTTPAGMRTAMIEYSVDAGTTWTGIASIEAAPGQYSWFVPHVADTTITTMLVRVSDADLPSRAVQSAMPFTVVPLTVSSVRHDAVPASVLELTGLFPNPARDEFNLLWNQATGGPVTVMLFGGAGEIVFVEEIGHRAAGEGSHRIAIGELASGTYLVRLTAADGVQHVRSLRIAR